MTIITVIINDNNDNSMSIIDTNNDHGNNDIIDKNDDNETVMFMVIPLTIIKQYRTCKYVYIDTTVS